MGVAGQAARMPCRGRGGPVRSQPVIAIVQPAEARSVKKKQDGKTFF